MKAKFFINDKGFLRLHIEGKGADQIKQVELPAIIANGRVYETDAINVGLNQFFHLKDSGPVDE